jgi:hypothetical protein
MVDCRVRGSSLSACLRAEPRARLGSVWRHHHQNIHDAFAIPGNCIEFRQAGRWPAAPRPPLDHMADGLNIVAIGVEHEGAVVVGMIVRPKSRYPVVFAAGCHRRFVECGDLGSVVCH